MAGVVLLMRFALVVFTAGALGFWVSRRLKARRRLFAVTLAVPMICIGASIVLARPSLVAPAYRVIHFAEMWTLPVAGGTIAFYLAAAWARQRGAYEKRLIAYAGVAALLVAVFQLWDAWPVTPGAPLEADGWTLQSTESSCSAASAVNFLRLLGQEHTEVELIEKFGTRLSGTSHAQLIVGLADYGYTCRDATIELSAPRPVAAPAFLVVDHPATGPNSHMILLIGQRDDLQIIVDPLVGRREVARSQLEERFHGKAIVCDPT